MGEEQDTQKMNELRQQHVTPNQAHLLKPVRYTAFLTIHAKLTFKLDSTCSLRSTVFMSCGTFVNAQHMSR